MFPCQARQNVRHTFLGVLAAGDPHRLAMRHGASLALTDTVLRSYTCRCVCLCKGGASTCSLLPPNRRARFEELLEIRAPDPHKLAGGFKRLETPGANLSLDI